MARIQQGKNSSKKDFIIEKAAGLFRARGYDATSMRDIANAVGVEAPSLYNHIGSKSEILQAICNKVGAGFMNNLEEVENSADTITQKIETVIRFHIRKMINEFDEVFVANHEWKHLENSYLVDFLTLRKSYEKKFMAIIDKGIEAGELKTVNSYITVLTILFAVRGLESWKRNKNNVNVAVLEEEMIRQLLYGIQNN